MYTMSDDHFEDQAIKLKKLFYKYKAKTLVIDGNGLGIGLLDYMVKSQNDEDGEFLPDFGVENDDVDIIKNIAHQILNLMLCMLLKQMLQ